MSTPKPTDAEIEAVIADLADMQMKDPDMAILTAFRLGLLVDTGKRQNGKIVYHHTRLVSEFAR